MSWLWFAIILAAWTAVCAGIYREQVERDEARRREQAREQTGLCAQLKEIYSAEYLRSQALAFHLRENRAELKALWDEQYALLRGYANGDFADWYTHRLWCRNREHWVRIIAAKGRITPMEDAS